MKSDIWTSWFKYLNDGFRMQKCQVLLLVDNAPSHCILNSTTYSQPDTLLDSDSSNSPTNSLSNIRIHYLPPNTMSHLQPLDAGIIKSFKAKYKRCYCRHILKQVESGIDPER